MSDSEDLAVLTGGVAATTADGEPRQVGDDQAAGGVKKHKKARRDKKSKKDKKSKRHRAEVPVNPAEAAARRAVGSDDDGSDDEEDDIFDFDAITDDEDDEDDNRRGGGLLDMDASEGEDDEDEASPQERAEEDAAVERIRKAGRAKNAVEFLQEMDDDAAAREFEERYKQRKQMEAMARTRQLHSADSSQRFSAAYLPRATDPKVFAVKVRPGYARTLVARIVNKCRAYLRGDNEAGLRQDLGIMSVFSVDHVKEWIYLEAHRQRFVETAIAGLEHVFRFKITQVDPRELMQLLERQAVKKDHLHVGQYVRVKSGNYGGDIGIVSSLQEEGRIAVLKLMPRENFQGRAHREPYKKGAQLPQHLFVPNLAIGARQSVNGDWTWSGCLFTSDGYLLQPFHSNRLVVGSACAPPTVEELIVYHAHNRDEVEKAVEALGELKQLPKTTTYKRDEPVKVVAGQLAGVAGRVVDMDRARNRITVATTGAAGGLESVTVPLDEISKLYQAGDHIIVESGPHAGEAGTVLFTNHAEAVILSDEGQREFRVEVAHCRASTMKAARPHTLGNLKLFDLVELSDDKGVGCIAGFTGSTVNVITPNNILHRTTAQHIKQVLNSKNTGVDRLLNSVTTKDAIVVDDEGVPRQFAKLRCTVQQVHIDVLFVTCPQIKANAGLFAIGAKSVVRVGGKSKHQKPTTFATLKTVYREPHPAKMAKVDPQVAFRSAMSAQSARTVDHEMDVGDLM